MDVARGYRTCAWVVLTGLLLCSLGVEAANTRHRSDLKRLMRSIQARDKVIETLQRRVGDLERRLDRAERPTIKPLHRDGKEEARSKRKARSKHAQPQREQRQQSQAATPGQFEIDEEAASRALERTLVRTGAMLLPKWYMEFQPSFIFAHDESRTPVALPSTAQGVALVREQRVVRDIFEGSVLLRLGLPFESQIDVSFPYLYVQSEGSLVNVPNSARFADGSGPGDFELGLSKTLVREHGYWPDLIGRVGWDSATGEAVDGGIGLGNNGRDEISGSLTAVKRQDPLVFVGGANYLHTFEKARFRPGDNYLFNIGAYLAASPETSLRIVLAQLFQDNSVFAGRTVSGTRAELGLLQFGASSVVGKGKFLDFVTTIGLTEDAPDYQVALAFSYRFGLADWYKRR